MECSGLVSCNKCSVLEILQKAKLHTPGTLKHQNTETSLYKLYKDHWVITLLEIFGYDIRNLQFIVSLDHPVVSHIFPPFLLSLLSSIMGFFVKPSGPMFCDVFEVCWPWYAIICYGRQPSVQRCDVCDVSFQSILFILVVTFSSFLSFSEKEFQSRQEGNLFWR